MNLVESSHHDGLTSGPLDPDHLLKPSVAALERIQEHDLDPGTVKTGLRLAEDVLSNPLFSGRYQTLVTPIAVRYSVWIAALCPLSWGSQGSRITPRLCLDLADRLC